MKLEVGMYVRTKYGVAKILSTNYTDDIVEDFLVVDKELEVGLISGCDWSLCDKKDVIKSSHNIIDLIEVGDYVNGAMVLGFDETYFNGLDRRKKPKKIGVIVDKELNLNNHIKEVEIKTIVTKEQFESLMYEVK